ncbi:MAG: succinate dehydrogenase, hydrophobic membrane anchor protein [Lysobacteraceae bacterium]|nr:MAG: succinate dehydrogenase, hydrophobic membrane anchor protein [Xanthomonadaceae bacterium]
MSGDTTPPGSRDFRTPVARARGLGSAKSGTGHFWWQRVSAVFLALLTPWVVGMLIALVGTGHDEIRAALGRPANAIPLVLFAISLFWHARLGLQVVVEDYVHHRATEIALQLLITFACALGGLVSLYAIARIALMP